MNEDQLPTSTSSTDMKPAKKRDGDWNIQTCQWQRLDFVMLVVWILDRETDASSQSQTACGFMLLANLSINTGALKVARYEEDMFPHFVAKLSTICPAPKC